MKSTVMWGLIGLNAVLLLMFAGGFNRPNAAHAQAAFRRPADYVLIPGQVNGASTSLVYIIDATNGKLGAMGYDDSAHQLITMPSIDLNRIFTNAAQLNQNRGGY
jgi:hypothetical protein